MHMWQEGRSRWLSSDRWPLRGFMWPGWSHVSVLLLFLVDPNRKDINNPVQVQMHLFCCRDVIGFVRTNYIEAAARHGNAHPSDIQTHPVMLYIHLVVSLFSECSLCRLPHQKNTFLTPNSPETFVLPPANMSQLHLNKCVNVLHLNPRARKIPPVHDNTVPTDSTVYHAGTPSALNGTCNSKGASDKCARSIDELWSPFSSGGRVA